MTDSSDELIRPHATQRPWLKPVIWACCFFLLLALIVIGWRVYRREQPRRLAERARESFKANDARTASVLLVRALQLNPDSVEASRALAEIFDQSGLPESVNWWGRVVELAPPNSRDRLSLAGVAIRHGRLEQAAQVLGEVAPEWRKTDEYLSLLGALAFARRDFPQAQEKFAAARELAPGNPEHALNELNARLNQARSAEAGRPILEEIGKLAETKGSTRLPALRILRTNYANLRLLPQALQASEAVLAEPGIGWPDRLAHLTILRLANDPRFPGALETARRNAAGTAFEAAALAFWMRTVQMHRDLLDWGATLPREIANHPEVASNLALSATALEDWTTLGKLVDLEGEKPWGPTEYLRLALLARSQRARNAGQLSAASWNRAVSAAMRVRAGGPELARLAQTWGWKDELNAVLWRTVETNRPEADDALAALFAVMEKAGNTQGLLRVFQAMTARRPEDATIANNYALLALLLKQNMEKAQQIAEDNYRRHPQAAGAILTQAYALLTKGQAAQAVALVRTLPPAEPTEAARRAPYVAAILRAGGDLPAAKEAAAAAVGATLLPEEAELLQAARP